MPEGGVQDRRVQVMHSGEHKGFRYQVKAMPMGHLCGYVEFDASHDWYNRHYDEIRADVHGGLTYAEWGENDVVWVLGFDCNHMGDSPNPALADPEYTDFALSQARRGGKIWPLFEVITECERLCEQADEARNDPEKFHTGIKPYDYDEDPEGRMDGDEEVAAACAKMLEDMERAEKQKVVKAMMDLIEVLHKQFGLDQED